MGPLSPMCKPCCSTQDQETYEQNYRDDKERDTTKQENTGDGQVDGVSLGIDDLK